MLIEGVVSGERGGLETALAQYLIRLEGSPLFNGPAVHKREIYLHHELGEVLHFIMRVSLV